MSMTGYNGLGFVGTGLCVSFKLSDAVYRAFSAEGKRLEYAAMTLESLEAVRRDAGCLLLPAIGLIINEDELTQLSYVAQERQQVLGGKDTVPVLDSSKTLLIRFGPAA